MTEAELAEIVIAWLQSLGWKVYQEVRPEYSGPRADIVAVRNRVSWVIEVKKTIGITVIHQALYWIPRANMISIAVPKSKGIGHYRNRPKHRYTADSIVKNLGLGLIEIDPGGFENGIEEWIGPKWWKLKPSVFDYNIRDYCHDEHQTFARAGTRDEYWTPFAQTKRFLLRYIGDHPGCTMKEAVENIMTHYSSKETARRSLIAWINQGVIKGIAIDHSTRPYKFYLREGNNDDTESENG